MRSRWFTPVVAAVLLAIGLLALPHLPAAPLSSVVTTAPRLRTTLGRSTPPAPDTGSMRDPKGPPKLNGTQPKLTFVLLGPAIMFGFWILALILPRIDPRGRGYSNFISTYWLIMNAIAIFIALAFAVSFATAFGMALAPARIYPGRSRAVARVDWQRAWACAAELVRGYSHAVDAL